MTKGLRSNLVLFLRVLSSFDDAERYWPVCVILRRAREISAKPQTNPLRILTALRHRGLVEGDYGHYRLTTAGRRRAQGG
jgi:hypothetical protein